MTTVTTLSTKTVNVAGVGPVELVLEERGGGRPHLILLEARDLNQCRGSLRCSLKRP